MKKLSKRTLRLVITICMVMVACTEDDVRVEEVVPEGGSGVTGGGDDPSLASTPMGQAIAEDGLRWIPIITRAMSAAPTEGMGDVSGTEMRLPLAIQRGDVPLVQKLLRDMHELETIYTDGFYLLHIAAIYGNLDIVRMVLGKYPHQINSITASKLTPLHLAASHGHLRLVRYLISKGAPVTARDSGGSTPYDHAANEGYAQVADHLKGTPIDQAARVAKDAEIDELVDQATERILTTRDEIFRYRGNTIEDGLRDYAYGSRGFSHSTYRDRIASDWAAAFEILTFNEFVDRRTVLAGNFLGIHFKNQRKYYDALSYYKRTLPMAQTLNVGLKDLLMNIGNVYYLLGRFAPAAAYMDAAFDSARDSGDKGSQASLLAGLAYVHLTLGDFDEALAMLDKALSLFRDLNERSGIATMHLHMGILHYHRDEYRQALGFFDKSKELYEDLGFSSEGQIAEIGMTYLALGEISEAASRLENSGSNMQRGHLELARKDYARALEYFKSSRGDDHHISSVDWDFAVHMGLARSYRGLGKKEEARVQNEKSQGVLERAMADMTARQRERFLKGKSVYFRRGDAFLGE